MSNMSKKIDFLEAKRILFNVLGKEKNIDILSFRFGLNRKKKETLEEIGQRFGVTRERIRQIQKALIKKIGESSETVSIFKKLTQLVKEEGGITKKSKIEELTHVATDEDNIVLDVLLLSCPYLKEVKNSFTGKSWAIASLDDNRIKKVIECIVSAIEHEGKTISENELLLKSSKICPDIKKNIVLAVISIADHLGRDIDGKIGLSSWGAINPRNTRDKAYVVFKKVKKPLHYRKITELISTENFNKNKRISVEAVHNELIRDSRFVLVGRGLYALSEWGYKPGTVADIIEEIFRKEGGALHKNEIIKRVLEKRFVKKNTILLNLQEKPQFVRVKRAVYKLREN